MVMPNQNNLVYRAQMLTKTREWLRRAHAVKLHRQGTDSLWSIDLQDNILWWHAFCDATSDGLQNLIVEHLEGNTEENTIAYHNHSRNQE